MCHPSGGFLCLFLLSFVPGAVLLPFGASQWAADRGKVAVQMKITGFDIEIGFNELIVYVHYYVTPLNTTIRMQRYVYSTSCGYEKIKHEMEKKVGEQSSGWWYPHYGLSWIELGDGHSLTIISASFLGVSLLAAVTGVVQELIYQRREYNQV